MRNLILIIITALIVSCSTAKRTQEALNTGNYTSAINLSISKLSDNKTKKGNQKYIPTLEDAFKKNTARELKEIAFLKKDGNKANLEKIYNAYLRLNSIQERIKPLLPLQFFEEGRAANFAFNNYDNTILTSKNELSSYLYENASNLVKNAQNKFDYRKAFDDFSYLNKLSPNYKDTRERIENAYQKGIDYVRVKLFNNTERVIPRDLEEDLLNFNAYDLNDHWTTYHTNPQKSIRYNYEMLVEFTHINISPEHIKEKEIIKEKRIKDGWEYVLDTNGNVAKDSLGNDLKADKFITVRSNFYCLTQQKDVQITGKVSYYDLMTKQQINSYPLASGFVFEHVYGNFKGDKRALDDDLLKLANQRAVPFPTNEQMIYDSGENLKNNIKSIITSYKFN
jgi:hypothetical protein